VDRRAVPVGRVAADPAPDRRVNALRIRGAQLADVAAPAKRRSGIDMTRAPAVRVAATGPSRRITARPIRVTELAVVRAPATARGGVGAARVAGEARGRGVARPRPGAGALVVGRQIPEPRIEAAEPRGQGTLNFREPEVLAALVVRQARHVVS